MAHTSPTIPMAVPLPPEPRSDLLWVGLGGSQSSKVTPTHHVSKDSRDEARDLRAVFSYLHGECAERRPSAANTITSQGIGSNWIQI